MRWHCIQGGDGEEGRGLQAAGFAVRIRCAAGPLPAGPNWRRTMAYEDALAAIPLFSRLEREDLQRLAKTVVPRKYSKGEEIVKEGEQAVAFYVITKGKVEVTKAGT
jgi:hypothetical protein